MGGIRRPGLISVPFVSASPVADSSPPRRDEATRISSGRVSHSPALATQGDPATLRTITALAEIIAVHIEDWHTASVKPQLFRTTDVEAVAHQLEAFARAAVGLGP